MAPSYNLCLIPSAGLAQDMAAFEVNFISS